MGTRAGLAYPEGDPAGLTAAAGQLSTLAGMVAGAAGSVGRAASVSGWEGQRYQVFVTASRTVATGLDPGAAALGRVSNSLAQLGERVRDAQRRIRVWAEEIEAAERKFETAQSELLAARFASDLAGEPLAAFPGPTRLQVAEAAFGRARERLDELRARYLPKARQLCDELRQDDERVAGALRAAAGLAPTAASKLPGALSLLDLKTDASAGLANRDAAFGAKASASIEAILAGLNARFSDGTTTYDVNASVGAEASASAGAEAGPNGIHANVGAEVQAGAKGSVGATLGDEDSFAITPSVDGRLGPGAQAHADLDIDADGLHVDVGAGLSPIVGGGVHVEVHVDPVGLLETVRDAPRIIEKVGDVLD